MISSPQYFYMLMMSFNNEELHSHLLEVWFICYIIYRNWCWRHILFMLYDENWYIIIYNFELYLFIYSQVFDRLNFWSVLIIQKYENRYELLSYISGSVDIYFFKKLCILSSKVKSVFYVNYHFYSITINNDYFCFI